VPEKEILGEFEYYGLNAVSVEDALSKFGKDAMEKLRGISYNNPEIIDDAVLALVLRSIALAPYDVFSILHNLAVKYPERSASLLSTYIAQFERYPKDAIEEFYYLCANDRELVNRELLDAVLRNASAAPFRVIMTLRMLLTRRPELLERRMVEWVRDNTVAGANQAFYFLRDIANDHPEHASLCVHALFQCVLEFHSNAYKKDFLRDIVSIAHATHVRTELAEALRKPVDGGSPAARELMALIFREKNQHKQMLLLEQMDMALNWDHVWDFLVLLLENPISAKDLSTDAAEKFLDGTYRLSFLLGYPEFRRLIHERVDMTSAAPLRFEGPLEFLNAEGVPALRGKVAAFANRLGETLELRSANDFLGRGKALEEETAALEKRISGETDASKREKMEKRLRNLREMAASLDSPPKRVFNDVRNAVMKELRAQLARLVELLISSVRRDAVRAASKRILGYESELWNADEKVYPALFLVEKLGRGNNRKYLVRLIEDRLAGRPHDWLWTEKPVPEWMERLKRSFPKVDLSRWRHPYSVKYDYEKKHTQEEKEKRLASELADVRKRMAALKLDVSEEDGHAQLLIMLEKAEAKDAVAVEELRTDLERIRRYSVAPTIDFQGSITLEVETDPFQYLFMGEYGFASCLSMQGAYFWSAVSNAVDVDKCVIWAKDAHGNILARRLIALTPSGIVSYRTYTNRQGLSLDRFFKKFIKEYAEHCGAPIAKGGRPGPLLSDEWYDDHAVGVD